MTQIVTLKPFRLLKKKQHYGEYKLWKKIKSASDKYNDIFLYDIAAI